MKEQKSKVFKKIQKWNDKYPEWIRAILIIVFVILLVVHILYPKRIDILTVVLLCVICLGLLRKDFYDFFKNMKAVGLPNLGLVISDLEAEIEDVKEENKFNPTENYVEEYNSVNEGIEKVISGLRSNMVEILEMQGEYVDDKNNFKGVIDTFSTKITNKEKTLSVLKRYIALVDKLFDFEQSSEVDLKRVIDRGFLLIDVLQHLKNQIKSIKKDNNFAPNIRSYKNRKKVTIFIDLLQNMRGVFPMTSINKNSFFDEKDNLLAKNNLLKKIVCHKKNLNVCIVLDNSRSMGEMYEGFTIIERAKKSLEDMFINLSYNYEEIKGSLITFDENIPFNNHNDFKKSISKVETEYRYTPLITSLIDVIENHKNRYDIVVCFTDGESYGENTESLTEKLKKLLIRDKHPIIKVIAIGSNEKFETLETISSWDINNVQIGFNVSIDDIKSMVNQIRQSLQYVFEIKIQNFKVIYIKIFNKKYKVYPE